MMVVVAEKPEKETSEAKDIVYLPYRVESIKTAAAAAAAVAVAWQEKERLINISRRGKEREKKLGWETLAFVLVFGLVVGAGPLFSLNSGLPRKPLCNRRQQQQQQ